MIERIIFNLLAFSLFFYIFLKMVKKNDSNYIYLLVVQALGILIGFVGLIINIPLNLFFTILTYLFSIAIPIVMILLEKKGFDFSEIIYFTMIKLVEKTDEEKARNILITLIEKNPQSYHAHKKLAELYEKIGQKQIAMDEYVKAVELNNKDYNSYYQIAFLLQETDKSNEATDMLKDLLRKKPEYYEASELLGNILYEQERFKEAVSVYLEALKYHPEQYDLYYNLGMVFTRLNDFSAAKDYYEKAADINQMLFSAKYNLAQIALICNELEEAETYFEESLQDNELEAGSYYYLAYISMIKGKEEKAIAFLNAAIEEDSNYYEKAKEKTIFSIIIRKINKPNQTKEKSLENTTDKRKDKKHNTIQYLEDTYELVGNLNKSDLKAVQSLKRENQRQTEREKAD